MRFANVCLLNKHYINEGTLNGDAELLHSWLDMYYTIQKLEGISNEMLCILVDQGTAKLQEVKFGGLK